MKASSLYSRLIRNAEARAQEWGVGFRPAFVFFSALEIIGSTDSQLRAVLYHWHSGHFRNFVLDENERLRRVSLLFARLTPGEGAEIKASDVFSAAAAIDHDLIDLVRTDSTTRPYRDIVDDVLQILNRISAQPSPRKIPAKRDVDTFAVIIQGRGQQDDSNRYSSLEHARRALDVLKAKARGIQVEPGTEPSDYIFVSFPAFMDRETEFRIREI